ncbi:MAG: hypothetical protein HC916_12260 [Coleofasciculaceae cyanobacterium SM2_1_6]|nr:hypothetical protein [Coleofasciculaceae cyanobacterium SM2_1_6]
MSKIRTLNDLSDRLSEDLAWRKKELSILEGLIETRSFGQNKTDALIRSGIALLYGHWEGYIKCAASAYLEFVSRQKDLKYCELAYNFVAIAMKKKLSEASATNQSTIHNQVIQFLVEGMEQRIDIPRDNIIKTGSNLSSNLFQQILALLGIDYRPYELKQVLIDKQLLKRRNQIAHGEYLDVDIASYRELHKEIIWMMDYFKDQIENHAVQKLYLRVNKVN